MCIGRNYADHIKELNSARPKQPFFFLKPPSAILLPGAGPVLRPKGVIMHYEVELALIIGKQVKDLHPEDTEGALDAISGESSMFRNNRMRAMQQKSSILSTQFEDANPTYKVHQLISLFHTRLPPRHRHDRP